ncbi:MAG: hypothetical protein R8G33_04925 [Gammaproteobacteria bacterium]|nr:hypothetical protein [Gammaproteobacteria bacterium]
MIDDPNDTLTTIEAKVLCLRYGIKNIDASNSVKKLSTHQVEERNPSRSITVIAKALGSDKDTVKYTEQNALRKLNISK